jgi:Uma2 family endonuclease
MSHLPLSADTDFAWEVATLFPPQGDWSENAYLDLTDRTNRRIEYAAGRLEFLPMPTELHEALVQFLFFALYQFVDGRQLGKVYSSGIRVRVGAQRFCLPDVLFLRKENFHLRHNRVWDGADLVMEVVSDSPSDRQRDYEQKLRDYAEAGIAEYWIVDSVRRTVSIYLLSGDKYAPHGELAPGEQAASATLAGFAVDVTALFAVADGIPE